MAEWPPRLSILLIVIVLGICIYRARTQSFSIDEAWAYNSFVAPPLSKMAQEYDACNHVLHTLLLKAAKASLGGGELALRTPSLIAAGSRGPSSAHLPATSPCSATPNG